MKKSFLSFLIVNCALCIMHPVFAQIKFVLNDTIHVTKYGNYIPNPWTGGINFSMCDYKNDTARSKWCLSDNLSISTFAGPLGSACSAITGWSSSSAYCPIPGTITNSTCYYNPTEPRVDDCNGVGCAVLSMPIN